MGCGTHARTLPCVARRPHARSRCVGAFSLLLPFSRKKKVEGSGNGIKTKIPNLADIAKDLHRDAADILKLFGFELGAVTIKMDETNTYIVNGKFSANELADVLDAFIEKFVLCGSCRNPETIVVPSKGLVKLRCISCGNETTCDPKHKLTDFILKDAARRKLKAKQEAMAASEANAGKKKSSKSKKDKTSVDQGGDDGGDATEWSVDVSSAAVKARRRAALGVADDAAAGSEGGAKEAQAPQQSPEDEFKAYVVNGTGVVDPQKLRVLRDSLRLSPQELATRVANSIFDPDNIMKQIIPAAKRWAPFFAENAKAQDALVAAVVDMALLKEDSLLPNLATLLKGLYDQDYVDEEAILRWYDNVQADDARLLKAKLKVATLAQWLRADTEESSDEEPEK